MPAIEMTAAWLKSVLVRREQPTEFYDAKSRGLTLRVFANGNGTWSLRYRPGLVPTTPVTQSAPLPTLLSPLRVRVQMQIAPPFTMGAIRTATVRWHGRRSALY